MKEIAFDILSFGRVRPYIDQVLIEAYRTVVFNVLVSMVQTYVRVKINCEGHVAFDGQEAECCLRHIDIEAGGWRIEAMRCTDKLELSVMASWSMVDNLPCSSSTTAIFTGLDP